LIQRNALARCAQDDDCDLGREGLDDSLDPSTGFIPDQSFCPMAAQLGARRSVDRSGLEGLA